MADKTLIFIPTYNERENVERLCTEILALKLDSDLLFMDDNSPDGTGELLDRLAQAHPRVSVVHRPGKQGIGSAHLAGIYWAYNHGYSRLVTMDSDFTHSPADMARLVTNSEGFSVTVGSRFLLQDSIQKWGLFRMLLTHAGHAVTRTFLKLPFDASGALRVYHLEAIPRELFSLVVPKGYAFFFESLFILARNGTTIQELPIVLPSRTAGHSKMSFKEIFRGVSRLFLVSLLNVVDPKRFRLAPKGVAKAAQSPVYTPKAGVVPAPK